MAEADRAATESAPAHSDVVEGETPAQSETAPAPNETAHQPTERGAPQDVAEKQPSPPLPPRPLATPHHANARNQPLPPPLVQYSALPPPLPTQQGENPEEAERPRYPRWEKSKLVLGSLSLLVSVVILGMAITYGLQTAQWDSGDIESADILMGTSGAAAGLAIVITTADFWKTALSSRRQGMHPGALVGFHLIAWLMAAVALSIAAVYASEDDWYIYDDETSVLAIYQQVLLGFNCVLLLIHFTLFVGACVETNRLERARRRVVVVQVPMPVGASYPGAYYPYYAPPGSFAPPAPGAQPGQYHHPPMMMQVPPQDTKSGAATGPAVPQPAAMYGGYYAPAPPPGMAWGGAQNQPQQVNPALFQGYYAPVPPPARTPGIPAPPSQREPAAPAAASGSRYRRSQRQAQAPGPAAAAPAPQQQEAQQPASEQTV